MTEVKSQSELFRDLQWCVQSPPLVTPEEDEWPLTEWFAQLAAQRFDIDPPPPGKLGYRFESLLHQWLAHSNQFNIVATNQQVIDAGRTVGEFDLLVRDGDQLEHWEFAVKFYLGVGDGTSDAQWFGPNPEDTLAKKVGHMRRHQLRLSAYPEARSFLNSRNWHVDRARAFVKGRLFYPVDRTCRSPLSAGQDHQRGWWEPWTQFRERLDADDFIILKKDDWLAPVANRKPLSTDELFAALDETSAGTVHIARLDHLGNERSRGFVVYDKWLEEVSSYFTS